MTLHAKPFTDKHSPRVLSVYDDDSALCNLVPQLDDSERDWATLFALSLELVATCDAAEALLPVSSIGHDKCQSVLAKVPARFKQRDLPQRG